jgi:hypothetical protein
MTRSTASDAQPGAGESVRAREFVWRHRLCDLDHRSHRGHRGDTLDATVCGSRAVPRPHAALAYVTRGMPADAYASQMLLHTPNVK